MASFDYDVLILGSGFGGSVAALRAAEKGYRVGVMESGSRWPDEKIPKTQWDLAHLVCSTTSAPAPSGRARSPEALLTGITLMCQCHGSRFDITTGAVIAGPASEALKVYDAREVDGSIQVRA